MLISGVNAKIFYIYILKISFRAVLMKGKDGQLTLLIQESLSRISVEIQHGYMDSTDSMNGRFRFMRIRILILPSLLLLAFFAINACSIKWDDPGSQSIDQMFTGDNRSIDDLGVTRTVNTGSFSSGSPISESSSTESSDTGSFGTGSSGDVQTGQEPINANSGAQTQSQSSVTAAIQGKWSMEFNFGSPPKATLNLFQNQDKVYGTGAIILDPKTNLEVATGGTVIGNQMNLDMISLGNVSLYSISMTVIGNSASGTYTAYRPGASSPISGTATGLRSAT